MDDDIDNMLASMAEVDGPTIDIAPAPALTPAAAPAPPAAATTPASTSVAAASPGIRVVKPAERPASPTPSSGTSTGGGGAALQLGAMPTTQNRQAKAVKKVEPNSRIRIDFPTATLEQMPLVTAEYKFVPLAGILATASFNAKEQPPPRCMIGAVTKKMNATKGGGYGILAVWDMIGNSATGDNAAQHEMRIMVKGTAFATHFLRLDFGDVLCVCNPSLVPPKPGVTPTDKLFSVSELQQIKPLGRAADLATCRGVNGRTGEACKAIVNAQATGFCDFHLGQAAKEAALSAQKSQARMPGREGQARAALMQNGLVNPALAAAAQQSQLVGKKQPVGPPPTTMCLGAPVAQRAKYPLQQQFIPGSKVEMVPVTAAANQSVLGGANRIPVTASQVKMVGNAESFVAMRGKQVVASPAIAQRMAQQQTQGAGLHGSTYAVGEGPLMAKELPGLSAERKKLDAERSAAAAAAQMKMPPTLRPAIDSRSGGAAPKSIPVASATAGGSNASVALMQTKGRGRRVLQAAAEQEAAREADKAKKDALEAKRAQTAALASNAKRAREGEASGTAAPGPAPPKPQPAKKVPAPPGANAIPVTLPPKPKAFKPLGSTTASTNVFVDPAKIGTGASRGGAPLANAPGRSKPSGGFAAMMGMTGKNVVEEATALPSSSNEALRLADERERLEAKIAKFAAADKVVSALQEITSQEVDAVYCYGCKRHFMSPQRACVQSNHRLERMKTVKKYFSCDNCKHKLPWLGGFAPNIRCPRCNVAGCWSASNAAPENAVPFHLLKDDDRKASADE